MVSDNNEFVSEETLEIDIRASKTHGYIQINIPYSDSRSRRRRLLDFLKQSVSRVISVFRRTVDEREEISASVPSGVSIRQHFDTHFIKRLNLPSLVNILKNWIKHPVNAAFLIWLICVAISGTMLGLLLLGFLSKAYPTKSLRNRWIEINSQVLNGLFTLMSLYQHPNLFHHLVLLCRWRSDDIVELRKIYCKNGGYRPHEWAHMLLVVILLHITCFAQYVSCFLYWTYSSKLRPALTENASFAIGTIAPIIAGLYTVYSPLGRGFVSDTEEELRDIKISNKAEAVSKPEWNGGLFDCRNDKTAGFLACCCTFCVFGWNMERIGFGNMYVHMVTFFLLCVAPFWILGISAMNISNDAIRDVVGTTGLLLCVFGLLYGGFWRIKTRERFGLLGNTICCGSESMTDYVMWMFCWACSLAQEVRTVNLYDVEDDSFHKKREDSDEESLRFVAMMMTPPTVQHSIQLECTDGNGNLGTKVPSSSQADCSVSCSNQNVSSKS